MSACLCACVCVCIHAFRIVSKDKSLHFINALIIIFLHVKLGALEMFITTTSSGSKTV